MIHNRNGIQSLPPWSPHSGDGGRPLIGLCTLVTDMRGGRKWLEKAGKMVAVLIRQKALFRTELSGRE